MKSVKNILGGFLVSFIGSIPLGYLNIIGFEIYSKLGLSSLVLYLFGVISVEVFVIYFTLIFANILVHKKTLLKAIDFFGVFFLLFLAYSFYEHSQQTGTNNDYLEKYFVYSPFLVGLFLNCLNFLQVPFWMGWNLYLINSEFISIQKKFKYYYIAGTLIGVFLGMMTLVLILHAMAINTEIFSKYIMPVIIPMIFIVLACIQVFKVYKKHFKQNKNVI